MDSNLITMFVVCLAVLVLGLGKGGITGLAALATPIMAFAYAPVQAAAILLPIMLLQDVVSVWAYRASWNKWILGWMLPGAVMGIAGGYVFAAMLPKTAVMGALGAITLFFGLYRLWLERGGRIVAASNSPGWVGSLFGIVTGFTSQIAHAGGPPFQMWVTARNLPHLTYLGTSAIFFATVNIIKLPAYVALGEITLENLQISALLTPLAVVSTFGGVWIAHRINTNRFYTIVYLLMVLLGARLLWDSFAN